MNDATVYDRHGTVVKVVEGLQCRYLLLYCPLEAGYQKCETVTLLFIYSKALSE